jgi:CDP-glucose 4,6-dehydratase
MVETSFWQNKKVFITGHTGFKGTWLSLMLTHLGAEVTGYSLDPLTKPSMYDAVDLFGVTDSVIGDIRDEKNLTAALENSGAEVVFHLAAQSLVRESYVNPVETYSTNVMGTVHLLEAVRKAYNVKAAIMVTSDKCYAANESLIPHIETDAMGGHDPYSSSKGAMELVCASYANSFFCEKGSANIATARAGNVIGGGDWSKDRLVPDILASYADKQKVSIRNPNAVRPWQFVLDPLYGYLELAEYMYGQELTGFGEGWNFGPDSSNVCAVKDIVSIFKELSDNEIDFSVNTDPQPYENPLLNLNSCKAKERLAWKPSLKIEDALAWTYNWHIAFEEKERDMRSYTLQQIEDYLNLAEST